MNKLQREVMEIVENVWFLNKNHDAKENAIELILEHFEWKEICNNDWEYSEKENLERAEGIYNEAYDIYREKLDDPSMWVTSF